VLGRSIERPGDAVGQVEVQSGGEAEGRGHHDDGRDVSPGEHLGDRVEDVDLPDFTIDRPAVASELGQQDFDGWVRGRPSR
jgi:hypothetical protein